MGFDNSAGPNPKYRTAEHRKYRASLVAQLKRDGYLTCTAKVCVFDTRDITNPNGRERDGLHAGHNDAGTEYDGPQHNLCNVRDGARRGRARQDATNLQWLQGEAAPHPWLRKDYHPCPSARPPYRGPANAAAAGRAQPRCGAGPKPRVNLESSSARHVPSAPPPRRTSGAQRSAGLSGCVATCETATARRSASQWTRTGQASPGSQHAS